MKKRIVGIVPARGGSKGVLGKNIRVLGSKPLILHTLDAARESCCFDSVYVTTDSQQIRDVVVNAGYVCPDLRPPELSQDDSMIIDVLRYCVPRLESIDMSCDSVCLLQPTSPFRTSTHIKEAVELYRQGDCDTLVSVIKVPHRFHPRKLMVEEHGYLKVIDPEGPFTRKINEATLWGRNGPAILIVRGALVLEGLLYGSRIKKYEMDLISSIDIDSEEDWDTARRISDFGL